MEEVLDLLMSFVDFQAFKDLMLAHKMETTTKPMQVGNPRTSCKALLATYMLDVSGVDQQHLCYSAHFACVHLLALQVKKSWRH